MASYMELPDLELSSDAGKLPKDASELASKVRSDWSKDKLRTKMFNDGISNALIGVYQEGDKDDMVLVRIYGAGTEMFIDRSAELRNMSLFHAHKCGPRVYATFKNGIAYSFLPGKMVDTASVRDPKIYPLVASMMSKMHKMDPSTEPREPVVFQRMRKFLELAPDGPAGFDSEAKRKQAEECKVLDKAALSKEIDLMEKELAGCNSPIVFSHNDLLLGNIVIDKSGDGVKFIDYEYGGFNYQGYDIGNHFSEFVGVGDKLDFVGLFPDEAFQKGWIRKYLECYRETGCVLDADVDETYALVSKFVLCAHLLWGIWSLMQAKLSAIDFDFIDYHSQKINEYFRLKKLFL